MVNRTKAIKRAAKEVVDTAVEQGEKAIKNIKKAAAPKIKELKKAAAPKVKAAKKAAGKQFDKAVKVARAAAKDALATGAKKLKKASKAL